MPPETCENKEMIRQEPAKTEIRVAAKIKFVHFGYNKLVGMLAMKPAVTCKEASSDVRGPPTTVSPKAEKKRGSAPPGPSDRKKIC